MFSFFKMHCHQFFSPGFISFSCLLFEYLQDIQRVYSMLNAKIPVHSFTFIIIDYCNTFCADSDESQFSLEFNSEIKVLEYVIMDQLTF